MVYALWVNGTSASFGTKKCLLGLTTCALALKLVQSTSVQLGCNGCRKRRHSNSSTKMVIKPIAPKEYNGSADARTYHQFVRESDAYLRDGKVKGCCRIFLLSHYLTDKAYNFYMQKVANNEAQWSLSQFYNELFNYCFPVDYRMQVRKSLAHCHQNDKSVAEYTHELIELFN